MIEFDYRLLDEQLPGFFEKALYSEPEATLIRNYPEVFFEAKFDVIAEFQLFSFNLPSSMSILMDGKTKPHSFREMHEYFREREAGRRAQLHDSAGQTDKSKKTRQSVNALREGYSNGRIEAAPADREAMKHLWLADGAPVRVNSIQIDFGLKQDALFTALTDPMSDPELNRIWTEDYAGLVMAILDGCYFDNGEKKQISAVANTPDDLYNLTLTGTKHSYAYLCYKTLTSRSLFILYNYWRYDRNDLERVRLYLRMIAAYITLIARDDLDEPIYPEEITGLAWLEENGDLSADAQAYIADDINSKIAEVNAAFRRLCDFDLMSGYTAEELGEYIVTASEDYYEQAEKAIEAADAELKEKLEGYDETIVRQHLNCDYDIHDIHLKSIADHGLNIITGEFHTKGHVIFKVGANGAVSSIFGDFYTDAKRDDKLTCADNLVPYFINALLGEDCPVSFTDREYYEKLTDLRELSNLPAYIFDSYEFPADLDLKPYYEYELGLHIRRARDNNWRKIAILLANLGICLENLYLFNYVALEDENGLFDDVDVDALIDMLQQRVYGRRFGRSIKKSFNKLSPDSITSAERSMQLETAQHQVSLLRKFPKMLEQFIEEVRTAADVDEFMMKRQRLLDNISNFELDDEILEELGSVTDKICEKLKDLITGGTSEHPDLIGSIRDNLSDYCVSLSSHIHTLYDGRLTDEAVDEIINKALSYIVTGEILYDMYVKEKSQYHLLDFGCVAIEYYKAIEYMMNTILYYPYYDSVLSRRTIAEKNQHAKNQERPYCGWQLDYVTYSQAKADGSRSYHYKNELEYGTIANFYNKTISQHNAAILLDFLKTHGVDLNKLKNFTSKMKQTAALRNQCAHPNQNQKSYAVKARDVIYERDDDHLEDISLISQAQGIRRLLFEFNAIFAGH